MKNRWLFPFISMILLSASWISHANANTEEDLKPLLNLHSFMHEENLPLTSFELMMRKTMKWEGEKTLEEVKQALHLNTPFKTATTNQSKKYYIENVHKKIGLSEQVIVIKEKGNLQPYVEIIYTLSGKKLDKNMMNSIEKHLNLAKSHIFQENTPIYTCLQSKTDAIIKNSLLDKFMHDHKVDLLHKLEEEDFLVISGYTDQWDVHVPISEDSKMNVQFSIRRGLDGMTYVTIGTPILTVEY